MHFGQTFLFRSDTRTSSLEAFEKFCKIFSFPIYPSASPAQLVFLDAPLHEYELWYSKVSLMDLISIPNGNRSVESADSLPEET